MYACVSSMTDAHVLWQQKCQDPKNIYLWNESNQLDMIRVIENNFYNFINIYCNIHLALYLKVTKMQIIKLRKLKPDGDTLYKHPWHKNLIQTSFLIKLQSQS